LKKPVTKGQLKEQLVYYQHKTATVHSKDEEVEDKAEVDEEKMDEEEGDMFITQTSPKSLAVLNFFAFN